MDTGEPGCTYKSGLQARGSWKKDSGPDVLFVFGAGASHAEGAPLQRDILPYILDRNEKIVQSAIGAKVRDFIAEYFAWDRQKNVYPSLEAVFAFLDFLIYRNESLGGKCTHEYIRDIRESLVKLIHYSVGKVSGRRTGVYRKFWERVRDLNLNVSVFTTNYDTYIDEAFDVLYPRDAYLDYGIRLLNEDIEPTPGYSASYTLSGAGAARLTGASGPVPIKLIKLHGSLNWKYCNCCGQVLLTPPSTPEKLENAVLLHGNPSCEEPDNDSYPCRCPHDDTPFQTLIVPPAHMKFFDHPTLNSLLVEASRTIRMASKIVFIGYSFPDADIHLKALFKKNLREDIEIIVLNRNCDLRIRKTYEPLSRRLTFIPGAFEDAVENFCLIDNLLTGSGIPAECDARLAEA